MSDSEQFPFALEPKAVDQWLISVNSSEYIQLSNQLYQILRNLNHANIDKVLLFEIVAILTPKTLELVHELEQKFFCDLNSLDAKPRKLGRLGLHLLRELITAYHKITTTTSTDSERLHQSIGLVFELIGQHMLLSAKISERPSNIYWKISSLLYKKALQEDLLHKPLDNRNQKDSAKNNIENQLKRNLLFSISNAYRCNFSEIDYLFSILTEISDLAEMEEANPIAIEHFCFVWEYEALTKPTAALHGKIYHPAIMLNTNKLVKHLQSSNVLTPFTTFNNTQHTLSGYEKIIHTDIPTEPKVCQYYSGFEQISKAMYQQTRKNKIFQHRLDSNINSTLMEAKLEPLDHELSFMSANNNYVRTQNNDNKQSNTFKILKTQHVGYIIAVAQPTNRTLDNLVLIVNENNNLELGIIRKVQNISQSNTQRILIELIPGEVSCPKVQNQNSDSHAILVYQSEKLSEIFLIPKPYTTGSELQIGQKNLILDKLKEITPNFMRYQIAAG